MEKELNYNLLTAKEIRWLYNHRCKLHNRRYSEHPHCFFHDHPNATRPSEVEERVGFWDIETSNLDANFGIMITWSILDGDSNKVISDYLRDEDFAKNKNAQEMFSVDKRLVAHLIDELFKFDRIVTHYGRKFDIPFTRTRAFINHIPFPGFGSLFNDDTYYMARNKMKLNSNRLDVIARALLGHSDKTHLDGAIWTSAARGDKESIQYILEHNKIDVIELKKIWDVLHQYVGFNHTSI